MTLRKAKAKISPQNRQNSITSQNNSWFYLRTCVRMSVNPLLMHVPNSFFLCIFFGRNVTQFISNDGLKILGIIKTYKITSSFLKIDVFLLCTSTIFSKIIFFFSEYFWQFFFLLFAPELFWEKKYFFLWRSPHSTPSVALDSIHTNGCNQSITLLLRCHLDDVLVYLRYYFCSIS